MNDVPDSRPVVDLVWFHSDYLRLFGSCGLKLIEHRLPLGRADEPYDWLAETSVAPWTIYVVAKGSGAITGRCFVRRDCHADALYGTGMIRSECMRIGEMVFPPLASGYDKPQGDDEHLRYNRSAPSFFSRRASMILGQQFALMEASVDGVVELNVTRLHNGEKLVCENRRLL